MTGEYDFLLKIAVRDMDAYHDFVLNRLSKLPNVAAVRSFFVMKEAKCHTAYPLDINSSARKKNSAGKV
jgi:DNA-binding Lrp family transcriptional regulator